MYLTSLAVDGTGNLYSTEMWDGPDAGPFPTTPSAFQTAPLILATAASIGETIVGKPNAYGSKLLYGT